MKQKSETIFSNSPFRYFIITIILVLVVSSPLLFINKEIPTFWINQFHSPFLDSFFYYITYLGDGLVLLPVVIFLLFRSYVWAGFFALFTIVEAFLVQIVLKKGIFAHLDRPMGYIENFSELHQVSGADIHSLHTFPSGHTQTIFLVITILALVLNRGYLINTLLIFIGIFTALSRVYLLQHFFVDIWVGAFIGVSIPVITIYLLQKFGKFPESTRSFLSK